MGLLTTTAAPVELLEVFLVRGITPQGMACDSEIEAREAVATLRAQGVRPQLKRRWMTRTAYERLPEIDR
jgi:hypothetical protein